MKVILLQDVAKVGKKNDLKEVADGYGRNFLIGRGLAMAATPSALASLALKKKTDQVNHDIQHTLLQKSLVALKDVKIVVQAKANDEGHLFAGLHEDDIVKAVRAQTQIELDATWLAMDKAIKTIGDHEVQIKTADLSGPLFLSVEKK